MSTIKRIKQLGEVFTPPDLVEEILDEISTESWVDPNKTWLDPTCGNGAFLIGIKNRLMEYHTEEYILDNMIFGADIMQDNIEECIISLYGDGKIDCLKGRNLPRQRAGLISMFKHNDVLIEHIVQADGLNYDYQFEKLSPMDIFS